MWRIDSYGVSKVKSKYFSLQTFDEDIKKWILKHGLEMQFSMDYKTIVCFEKDYMHEKIAAI